MFNLPASGHVCERTGCDTDVTAAPSGPEKRFCSSKCRAKANRTKRKMPDPHIATAASQAALAKRSIPSAVFTPIMRDYLERYQSSGDHTLGERAPRTTTCEGAINVLAREAGVEQSMIRKHLNGERLWIRPDFVDRLLCAMDRIDAWFVELEEYYGLLV